MPIYHYHAIKQVRIGEVTNLDGIAALQSPVLTMEDYKALKKLIADVDGGGIGGPDGLTICSLTLLTPSTQGEQQFLRGQPTLTDQELQSLRNLGNEAEAAADEIARLTAALRKANEQAERFERGWYLRGDVLEQARGALQKTMVVWGGTCAWHADVKAAIAAIDAGLKA
ncbi:hypothetical protein [Uliginosibacterium sediminicola]|uniref:Uncharacterized protein n=1 Tax=Uliginosibacterium sediminicola TaxID=2024550 RepID=A0ABU9YVX1_9RHOO